MKQVRYCRLLALLLVFSSSIFAGFSYLGYFNGTNFEDTDETYLFRHPSSVLAAGGKLYVADDLTNAFYIFNSSGYYNESENASPRKLFLKNSAEYVQLESPHKMTYYNGSVYIADGVSTIIRFYPGEGRAIELWNRKESSNLKRPSAIAFDNEHAYITDMENGRLYVYSKETRTFERIAVERGPSDGFLNMPADVEIYKDKVFVLDRGKKAIYAYSRNFTFLYSIGGGEGGLSSPRGMAIYNDFIYVADAYAKKVLVFTLEGYLADVLDSNVSGGNLSEPEDLSIYDGKLYLADPQAKKVLVYQIKEVEGKKEVLALISQANDSVKKLYSMQQLALKLNMTVEDYSYLAAHVVAAKEEYSRFAFSAAERLASKAIESANEAKLNLSQKIEVKIKQMVKAEQEKVEPYRRKNLSAGLLGQLPEFDRLAAEIKNKAESKYYSEAIGLLPSLSSMAEKYISAAQKEQAAKNATDTALVSSWIEQRMELLNKRAGELEGKAAMFRQRINLSSAMEALLAANSSMAGGDYAGANRSLGIAELEISSYEKRLEEIVPAIEEALKNISAFKQELANYSSKSPLIRPDFSKEKKKMGDAEELAYSEPEAASKMALEAISSARIKMAEAQSLSVAVSAILVMVGLTGIIAAAFALHLYARKRRKNRGATEEDEGSGEEGQVKIWKDD
ncbi:MAG: hypothetical protein N3G22_01475 [Candidatus Micrarchaeota archaeon]|nr:hypothetical protein [Candidatus Micrarchaeota archaeon]